MKFLSYRIDNNCTDNFLKKWIYIPEKWPFNTHTNDVYMVQFACSFPAGGIALCNCISSEWCAVLSFHASLIDCDAECLSVLICHPSLYFLVDFIQFLFFTHFSYCIIWSVICLSSINVICLSIYLNSAWRTVHEEYTLFLTFFISLDTSPLVDRWYSSPLLV